jgi:hypothetical protein
MKPLVNDETRWQGDRREGGTTTTRSMHRAKYGALVQSLNYAISLPPVPPYLPPSHPPPLLYHTKRASRTAEPRHKGAPSWRRYSRGFSVDTDSLFETGMTNNKRQRVSKKKETVSKKKGGKTDRDSKKVPVVPLDSMQKTMVDTALDKLANDEAVYLASPPGSGKTTLMGLLMEASVKDAPTLNIFAAPTAALVDEAKQKIDLTLAPFHHGLNDTLTMMLTKAEDGDEISIGVTHTWLRAKLSASKEAPKEPELVSFLAKVGGASVRLLIDEAHKLCSNGKWATALGEVKEKVLDLSLVLASGTPQMDKRKCKANAAAMLGLPFDAVERALITCSKEEEAAFMAAHCPLPEPERHTVALKPKKKFWEAVADELGDLALLIVGNMLHLVQCSANGVQRRIEIHAHSATKNLVSHILAKMAHLDANGDSGKGGPTFAQLEDKVPTALVKGGKIGESEGADPCMLVLHSTAKGLDTHVQLVEEMPNDGSTDAPQFTAQKLSFENTNAAKQELRQELFFEAFQKQDSGASLGFVLPSHMEGTDKYASCVSTLIMIGPMDDKVVTQAAGRFGRMFKLKEGERVRTGPTKIVHLTSQWATNILALMGLKATRGVDHTVMQDALRNKLLAACQGYDAETKDLAFKLAMLLEGAEGDPAKKGSSLVPDRGLVDTFCNLLKSKDELAEFMHVKKEKNANGKLVVTDTGPYWSTVKDWANLYEDAEEEGEEDEE